MAKTKNAESRTSSLRKGARSSSKPAASRREKAQGVPLDLLKLNPLITPGAAKLLHQIQKHPHAPRWNYKTGDWITRDDLAALELFRSEVMSQRALWSEDHPPIKIVQQLASILPRVEWLRSRIDAATDFEQKWTSLPCMKREDFAIDLGYIIPDNTDLNQVAIYETSGTTGHRLPVPNSAQGASSYAILIELAMLRHSVRLKFDEKHVAAFLVGAQNKTITYAAIHSVWNNSGYAKLNLNADEWPSEKSRSCFFADFDPPVLCGDPISFHEMARLKIKAHPKAMISTAMSLPPSVQRQLIKIYKCPVIDTYSLNECGLVASTCSKNHFHILPLDIYVEILDDDGKPAAKGERGEIAVTHFRNPYLPLLRYRTGDHARLLLDPCPCGDRSPRLVDFEGRAPIHFRSSHNSVVNTVDLSRIFRQFPLVQHRFVQHKDLSCEAFVRPISKTSCLDEKALEKELHALLGEVSISVVKKTRLDDGSGSKIISYESALQLNAES